MKLPDGVSSLVYRDDDGREIVRKLQPEWIPVSERLPEIGQRVLVTYNQEDKLKVDTTIFDRHGFLIGVVTAWMPLPEPYKGESEVRNEKV